MGIYERAKEILALADYFRARLAGLFDRPYARISRGAFYLYVVLAEC